MPLAWNTLHRSHRLAFQRIEFGRVISGSGNQPILVPGFRYKFKFLLFLLGIHLLHSRLVLAFGVFFLESRIGNPEGIDIPDDFNIS